MGEVFRDALKGGCEGPEMAVLPTGNFRMGSPSGEAGRYRNEPHQTIHDCHALLLWIISQLNKFPRLRRYTLGERIETLLLQVLERLLEAAYSSGRDKTRALQRASQQLNVFRHLWRLSHELRAVLPRAHAHGGAWNNNPRNLRCANRNRNRLSNRNNNNGFRLVQAPWVPERPRLRSRPA